ncbi:MAG: archaeal cell division control protein 6 [Archaeoglobi archaeon]|nr:ORC1-type DNA replication protein [Candidatus Mnemosynella bozhongmuii]MDI3502014.1 archaeal cell division control protein 6 [Archaeoglobi archaeon]MDK2781528.1 archaeal cell division control protein 6 [Archaeoglobi archaeon]
MSDILMRDETLFKNPEVFELDYLPDVLLYRDSQLQSLRFGILPALRGLSPLNSILIGPPATGKTSAVKFIFRELEETEVLKAYVNCNVDHTRHLILSHIFKEIFGFQPPLSGVSFTQLFEKVMKKISELRRPLIVALDDINALLEARELDDTVNSLLRAGEVFEGLKVGVILVASEIDFRRMMSSRTSSILQAQEIVFPPYTKDEIRGILKRRVELGLYPGVMNDEILERIVEETEKAGDLRLGIGMIKFSALHAERNARRRITEEDLEFALSQSQKNIFASILRNLGKNELLILKKIVESDKEVVSSGELYRMVSEEGKMGYTTFYEYLNKLDNLRIIHMDFTGRGKRGRTRNIRLRYPRELLRESLDLL